MSVRIGRHISEVRLMLNKIWRTGGCIVITALWQHWKRMASLIISDAMQWRCLSVESI